MDKVLPRPTAATREITQHYMETVSIKHLIFEDPVMEKHVMFHIHPKRWTALVKSVADAGTTFTEADETGFAAQWDAALAALPEADKRIVETDLSRRPPNSGTWYDKITPRRCMGSDLDNATLALVRSLVTGAWTDAMLANDPFATAVEILVPDAAASRSHSAQATAVLAKLRDDPLYARHALEVHRPGSSH